MPLRKLVIPWQAHPHKDQAWYDGKKQRMTRDEIARELDRNYHMSQSGRVFEEFNPLLHAYCGTTNGWNPHLPVWRIWDFGRTNATVYGQIFNSGNRKILFERVLGSKEQGSNTNQQIAIAIQDSNRLFPGAEFRDICDPAGSYLDHRGSDTDVSMLQSQGIYPIFNVITEIPTKDRKKRGRDLVKGALEKIHGGEPALMVYDHPVNGAPCTKEAFESGYRFKLDRAGNITETIDEAHPHEDVMDCVIYWMLETQHTNPTFTPRVSYYGGHIEPF